jgi:hypothetical protein
MSSFFASKFELDTGCSMLKAAFGTEFTLMLLNWY